MKHTISGVMLTIFFAAGCARNPMTRFEYGSIRLDVGGRITEAQSVAMLNRKPGVYYCRDGVAKQILIEAKLVEFKDMEILGVKFFGGKGPLISATKVKNTTPKKSPPIAMGGLINLGGSIGGDRDGARCRHGYLLADCDACSSSGGGTGINIPIGAVSSGEDNEKFLSLRATFDLNASIDIETGYLVFDIKVGMSGDKKIIVQPILIPTTVLQNGDGPPVIPPKKVTTAVSIQNGQTVMIGGLLSDSDKDLKQKVPLLNDIPLLGRLFKSKDNTTIKRNLIIFVTPHIVKDAE
jgi:hypothetical protein